MRRSIWTGIALTALVATLTTGGARGTTVAHLAAWPPPLAAQGHDLFDFVHYGENHHNEDGGPVVNGAIFDASNRYGVAFLANSSDMATTGTLLELGSFKRYITQGISPICAGQQPCQTALRVPWFHAMGNHDREPLAGPGGVASYTNGVYRDLFKDQPYPWGEDPQTLPAGFTVPDVNDIAGRLPGAATHYAVDYGPVRMIALDNSPHSFTTSDAFSAREQACSGQAGCALIGQNPPVGPGRKHASQLAFMEAAVADAKARGKLAFVFMHQPTTDPRDQRNAATISINHTMNKGASSDNAAFEVLAAARGVDAVLTGHIKGNNVYRSIGVPYYVNGGGGGNPYASSVYSVDYGTYYGYRLFRIADGKVQGSYLIPVVDRFTVALGGYPVTGPITATTGQALSFSASGMSPACNAGSNLSIGFHGCSGRVIEVQMRPPAPPGGYEASVPTPAFVWHTSDPSVVAPAAGSGSIDPHFDPGSMSSNGRFMVTGPGTAEITIVSGWARASVTVTVD